MRGTVEEGEKVESKFQKTFFFMLTKRPKHFSRIKQMLSIHDPKIIINKIIIRYT